MVEKVARAICRRRFAQSYAGSDIDLDKLVDEQWWMHDFEGEARAAIEALK